MLRAFLIIASLAVTSFAVTGSAVAQVQMFETGDEAMNMAMAEAQKTLPLWEAAFDGSPPGGTQFMLKVAVSADNGDLEHIWVYGVRRTGPQGFEGLFANKPHGFAGEIGDPFSFSINNVSDWSYSLDGKLHGNYTTRVALPRMDPAQAAELRAILAPLPEG